MPGIERIQRLLSGSGLRAQLLRGGVSSIGVKISSLLLGFVLTMILARALGPEEYGVYGFTLALISLIAIPAQVGLPNLVVRETAKARSGEDWPMMRGIWRWATRYVVISSLILLGVVALGLIFAGHRLSATRHDALLVALPLIPLVALGNIRGAALRGLRHVVLGQLPEKVIRTTVLILLSLGVVVLTAREEFNASGALGLYVLAAGVAFVSGAWLLWRARPQGVRGESRVRMLAPEWRRAVFPLAMISGLQFLNSHLDILLLGVLRSDEEVGLYRVAIQLANLVVFGLTAINMVLHPHIAKLYSEGKRDELQHLATMSARAILALALPPVLIFVMFGSWLLVAVFGDSYASAATALAILAVGQLVNAGMGSVGALLNMTGHERDTMRGMVAAVAVNVVLNFMLIPRFGIEGAASATAVTFAVWNIVLWRTVWKRLRIRSTGLSRF